MTEESARLVVATQRQGRINLLVGRAPGGRVVKPRAVAVVSRA